LDLDRHGLVRLRRRDGRDLDGVRDGAAGTVVLVDTAPLRNVVVGGLDEVIPRLCNEVGVGILGRVVDQ